MAENDTTPALEDGTITVSGHQTEIGEALRSHATEQLRRLTAKYFGKADDATAIFSRSEKKHGFACNIRVHAGRGLLFDGQGDDPANAYAAFAQALERVDKQMRRQKRALREDKPVNAMKEALL
ncbi:ribosome-associated translation inhibitor RaiA [Roseomonas sp. OT10]|uniref:ribosome hibernation-promoting factor, HPF/YfiA family n=1 Tax=Roseomonas cutis TaxID=2897332 RepID=UPI001E4AAEEC|nr:ribosome-associated translation inhibitor RaiA [Roseomonas sp. OT10]UFN47177.1 ribosome-associated translation inhibitor RaiA [Roseomonas sp. OT10]